jgi:hypothetical protein
MLIRNSTVQVSDTTMLNSTAKACSPIPHY